MTECPCINCPCMAICRLKLYTELINCRILMNFIVTTERPSTDVSPWRIPMFYALRPIHWSIDKSTGRFLNYE